MRHLNITREQAEAYKIDYGHYPLIIGEEYLYLDKYVRLMNASVPFVTCVVETRFGELRRIDPRDLLWKTQKI